MAACFLCIISDIIIHILQTRYPTACPLLRAAAAVPALTEHAQFIAIPTEGLDFKSSFPVVFPDSRFLVLPQLFFSTCLFPTPSLPFALISMFSSLPLTFMSRTRQRQDRTDIRESSLKTEKEKKKPLIHSGMFRAFWRKAHLCEFKSLYFHTEISLAFCLWYLLSTLRNLSEWSWIS